MNSVDQQRPSDRALTQLLFARIQERAGGRVRAVRINRRDGSVVVRGQADSFYAWQLAIAACREVLILASTLHLDCQLEVDA